MSADVLGSEQFAFPKPDCEALEAQTGMTLRDYFAAAALTGFASRLSHADDGYCDTYAKAAYLLADAMLHQRDH